MLIGEKTKMIVVVVVVNKSKQQSFDADQYNDIRSQSAAVSSERTLNKNTHTHTQHKIVDTTSQFKVWF